jgi:Lon protease-like protein
MSGRKTYSMVGEMPDSVPLFPLAGALLLPRGQMPLNIFEPRYLDMVDAALKSDRIIGMIQPVSEQPDETAPPRLSRIGCAGRITQFADTGDGRYLISLTGLCRFTLVGEVVSSQKYRQGRIDVSAFADDFREGLGEREVDRADLIRTLKAYVQAEDLEINWAEVNTAPTEALVNALAMMCPFGPREKQALLEAADLQSRAAILVAITEVELARRDDGRSAPLQ